MEFSYTKLILEQAINIQTTQLMELIAITAAYCYGGWEKIEYLYLGHSQS